jgi:hypothetical protein
LGENLHGSGACRSRLRSRLDSAPDARKVNATLHLGLNDPLFNGLHATNSYRESEIIHLREAIARTSIWYSLNGDMIVTPGS